MATQEEFITDNLAAMGKRIRQLRKQLGYTNLDIFAYEKGFDRTLYGRYERGKNLQFDTLLKIMHALEVSPKEFFSEGFE